MIEPNSIVCGECSEVMAGFPDDCIDLTVTSPPYDVVAPDADGNLITYPGKGLRDYQGYTWDFAAVACQLWRVTKPGGVVVWVVGDATVDGSETGSSFRQALGFMGEGFRLHDTMIYQTDKPPLNDDRYQACFEFMFVFAKARRLKTFNPILDSCIKYGTKGQTCYSGHRNKNGMFMKRHGSKLMQNPTKIRNSIWKYYVGRDADDKIAYQHPARFCEALARDHIISWSNPGDLVLDSFVGSGTVPKMCVEQGRNYIGIDISPEYCDLSRKRVAGARVPLPGLVSDSGRQPQPQQLALSEAAR